MMTLLLVHLTCFTHESTFSFFSLSSNILLSLFWKEANLVVLKLTPDSVQESLVVGFWNHLDCLGSNLGQLYAARQTPYLPYYYSGPSALFFLFLLLHSSKFYRAAYPPYPLGTLLEVACLWLSVMLRSYPLSSVGKPKTVGPSWDPSHRFSREETPGSIFLVLCSLLMCLLGPGKWPETLLLFGQ